MIKSLFTYVHSNTRAFEKQNKVCLEDSLAKNKMGNLYRFRTKNISLPPFYLSVPLHHFFIILLSPRPISLLSLVSFSVGEILAFSQSRSFHVFLQISTPLRVSLPRSKGLFGLMRLLKQRYRDRLMDVCIYITLNLRVHGSI